MSLSPSGYIYLQSLCQPIQFFMFVRHRALMHEVSI
jgi:hypothetical protein